ncbi:alpha/beta hydrolase [Bradyrhizobium genosp. P]|uniref:alpha/beta hydrolase n=1 Tax=Bradyrhizobium genosp. P TaxID=83641 RepID=UPI003CF334E7
MDQLIDTIALDPNVRAITLLCHSMGCLPTLEALRSRSMRTGLIGAKVKNVLLVAPDVDAFNFREQMQQMGNARPRFALFLSQDDYREVQRGWATSIWRRSRTRAPLGARRF